VLFRSPHRCGGVPIAGAADIAPGRAVMQKALALILLAMAPMATPSPTEVVQSGIEHVVQVVQDYDAGHPDAAEKRRSEIRRAAGRLSDFQEMARRTLARHWTER